MLLFFSIFYFAFHIFVVRENFILARSAFCSDGAACLAVRLCATHSFLQIACNPQKFGIDTNEMRLSAKYIESDLCACSGRLSVDECDATVETDANMPIISMGFSFARTHIHVRMGRKKLPTKHCANEHTYTHSRIRLQRGVRRLRVLFENCHESE